MCYTCTLIKTPIKCALEGRGSCSAMQLGWLHDLFYNTKIFGFIVSSAYSEELWLSQKRGSQGCGKMAAGIQCC